MLAWSIRLFRVRGIQLSVHFSFLLLLAFVAWQGWHGDPAQGIAGGWIGMTANVVTLLVLFTCVVLHELGHSFTAMRYGVGVRRILLMPIGGMAEFDNIPRQPRRELLITLAGPAVNFALAAMLWALVGIPDGWSLFNFDYVVSDFAGFALIVLHWNLLMGVFNLIPVFPMDGGRIFRASLATRLPYVRATFLAARFGQALALFGASISLFVFERLLTTILFAFIFLAAELEYRTVRRREFEEAHLRTMLARLGAMPRAAGEPPPL